MGSKMKTRSIKSNLPYD